MASSFQISRRRLAGAVLASAGAGAFSSQAHAACPGEKIKWDETVDVLVIGSGFAGLAAAIEAARAGAKTVVLEKMPAFGGNSIINGGIYPLPGSPEQKAAGVKDSPELLISDMLKAGDRLNHIDKVKTMVYGAQETHDWLTEIGVEWAGKLGMEGGHSVPRELTPKNRLGSGIVLPEYKTCRKLGVDIRLRNYVERIIRSPEGEVQGLKVRVGYRFPKTGSGTVRHIRARRGVVLCYGGFSADKTYRQIEDPKLISSLDTTNQPGATSELWREASRIGCHLIQVDRIQCLPYCNPKEKGLGVAFVFHAGVAARSGIWVSSLTGRRFVNEQANRKVRADAIFAEQAKGGHCFSIANGANMVMIEKRRPGAMKNCMDVGVLKKYETLEALCKDTGIPLEGLRKAIEVNDRNLAARKDTEFGRPYFGNSTKPLVTGPWYASELTPKVHHAMGGVLTDKDARCLDVIDDKPIPGLFAAGESTGGVHGAVRLGSCAVLDCLVNGRIAGKSAANRKA